MNNFKRNNILRALFSFILVIAGNNISVCAQEELATESVYSGSWQFEKGVYAEKQRDGSWKTLQTITCEDGLHRFRECTPAIIISATFKNDTAVTEILDGIYQGRFDTAPSFHDFDGNNYDVMYIGKKDIEDMPEESQEKEPDDFENEPPVVVSYWQEGEEEPVNYPDAPGYSYFVSKTNDNTLTIITENTFYCNGVRSILKASYKRTK